MIPCPVLFTRNSDGPGAECSSTDFLWAGERFADFAQHAYPLVGSPRLEDNAHGVAFDSVGDAFVQLTVTVRDIRDSGTPPRGGIVKFTVPRAALEACHQREQAAARERAAEAANASRAAAHPLDRLFK